MLPDSNVLYLNHRIPVTIRQYGVTAFLVDRMGFSILNVDYHKERRPLKPKKRIVVTRSASILPVSYMLTILLL